MDPSSASPPPRSNGWHARRSRFIRSDCVCDTDFWAAIEETQRNGFRHQEIEEREPSESLAAYLLRTRGRGMSKTSCSVTGESGRKRLSETSSRHGRTAVRWETLGDVGITRVWWIHHQWEGPPQADRRLGRPPLRPALEKESLNRRPTKT